jgi:PKD repeat protein
MVFQALPSSLSRRVAALAACIAAFAAILGVLPATAAAAPGDVGYQGAHFSGTGTAVTGAKPESKLWWNDGHWWASMWDEALADNFIYKLDTTTHTWTNTGVVIDHRSGTRADVLWDGTKLYVASHGFTNTAQSGFAAHLYRYSYDPVNDRYSLDAGFPAKISNYKSETLVIDKDSTGRLWATWVQDQTVYVNATSGGDATWGTPFALPVAGASGLTTDDISSLVSFGGNKVGVMWSNQNASAMYFSQHLDGDPVTSWRPTEAALSGPAMADDHISLKADGNGRVYAAVKTSVTDPDAPLVQLLVRNPSTAVWKPYVFGRQTDHHTRPIVVLDEVNGVVHMFATAAEAGGTVYVKSAPIDAPSFGSGVGTAFIRDGDSPDMNDATSTKQSVNATTGLVVMASNEDTRRYWHNERSSANPPPLTADFTGSPISGEAPLTVAFTDASSGSPVSWSWDFGDGSTSTDQNPVHSYASPGTYDVRLTVSDGTNTSTRTRSDYVTVGETSPISADFTASPLSGAAPLQVTFDDASSGSPTTWSWSFGDGTTSTEQNPVHTYSAAGTYSVTLTVKNSAGDTSTRTRSGYITVSPPPAPQASFTGSPTSGTAPLAVGFTDTSTGTPTSWTWDFGDGTTSTAQNPTHTYAGAGLYTVTLTVTNAGGSDTETRAGYIAADPPPTFTTFTSAADSWVSKTSPSDNFGADTALRVKNGGTSSTSKHYHTLLKFNVAGLSGSISSAKLRLFVVDAAANGGTVYTISNVWTESGVTWNTAPTAAGAGLGTVGPTTAKTWVDVPLTKEAFTGDGTYSLKLQVGSSADGTTWYSSREGANAPQLVIGTTTPPTPPTASFTGEPTSGSAPLDVAFTDTSTGDPTSWSWSFGDGATSTLRNPTHTYAAAGTYTVTLTASNAGGSHTATRTDYITVAPPPPPTASFTGTPTSGEAPLEVAFTDTSSGTPTSWIWDFGDGAGSTLQNPTHTYAAAGTYAVTLTASNAGGSDTVTMTDYVTVAPPPPPTASFTGTPTSGEAPLEVVFTDASTGGPTSWSWDFGDGGTSTAQHPTHTYAAAGTYSVTLTVTNEVASDALTRTGYVTVAPPPAPTASFTGTPTSGAAPLEVAFTDTSTGDPSSWSWDFGDGVTSTLRNPTHTYTTAGAYTVVLTVTNEGGSDTRTRVDYITVLPPGSQTFAPAADAYVDSGAPVTNNGTAGTLRAKFGGTTGQTYRSYLRFSLSGLTDPVAEAKLRLYVSDPANNGGNVYTVADNSWSETGVTWDNAPAVGTLLANVGPAALDTWVEISLPASAFTAGNGEYTLAVQSDDATDGTVWYASREQLNAPQLIVRTAPPPPPPTASFTGTPTSGSAPLAVAFTDTSAGEPTSWSWDFGDGGTSTQQHPTHTYTAAGTYTVTLTATNESGSDTDVLTGYVVVDPPSSALAFAPAADSYVASSTPSGNYGTKGTLRAKFGGTTSETYRSYLRFSVSGLAGPVEDAKLRLYVSDPANNGGNVYTVADNTWSETGITWSNAPAVGTLLADVGPAALGTWIEISLPANAFAAGNGEYTLAVQSDKATDGTVWYASRETATAPQLVLTPATP